MSDEEKKALERIDYIQDFIIENGQYNADVEDMQYFSRVLNLIEKQSKEIEKLKEDNKKKSIVIIEYQDLYEKLQDKIKAKIEEYKESGSVDGTNDILITEMQSLLEKE